MLEVSMESECPICRKHLNKRCLIDHLCMVHKLEIAAAKERLSEMKKTELELKGKRTENCEFCGRVFTTTRGLKLHVSSKHSDASDSALAEVDRAPKCCLCSKHMRTFTNVYFNDDGTVQAIGCFGHIGHELDPALLRWTEEQLEYLKFLLEEFSADYIIQKMRRQYEAKDSKVYFITRKDLWNIMSKYELIPGMRHKDDVISLKLREIERNLEDGIRYFKAQDEPSGKGFLLGFVTVIITPLQEKWLERYGHRGVSVDDTHNLTKYALKLATVMVVDERDRGLPAAFLLSAEMTSKELKILFDEIKRILPNFAPKALVSDEAMAFYNGFKLSFPNHSADHFFCRFHILQSWKRKTKECVKPEHQKGVIRAMRELLRIGDEAQFHSRVGELLTYLRLKNCFSLIQYLQGEYLGSEKIRRWAGFNRKGVVMSTSMYTERWHLRIKQEKLKRKANSRIDYVVDTLIKAVAELAEDFEVKDRRQYCSSFRINENNVQHRLAVRFYKGNPDKIHKIDNFTWNIDATTSDSVYRVEFDENCSCLQVNIHCSRCKVCPYAVSCTCRSGALAGVACMHTHAIKLYGEDPPIEPVSITESSDEPPVVELQHAEVSSMHFRDIRGELHTLRDDISKSYTSIFAKANALVKQEDDSAIVILTSIAERMRIIADVDIGVSFGKNVILPRADVRGGKPKMQKADLYTRAKIRKEMKSQTQSMEEIRVDSDDILFCSLCFQEDPELPPDRSRKTRRQGDPVDEMH
ncbi:zinc finger, C2H2 type [Ostertagia ostertagi]